MSRHLSLDTITQLADLDRFGAFDFAVPEHWLMQDPEKRRPHFWYYPRAKKPGRLFGRPLKWMAAARLALKNLRQQGIPELDNWLRLWAYAHPGKGLDRDGIEAMKRFIANSSENMRFHIGAIVSYHQIPPPPEGTFDEKPPGPEATFQSASATTRQAA